MFLLLLWEKSHNSQKNDLKNIWNSQISDFFSEFRLFSQNNDKKNIGPFFSPSGPNPLYFYINKSGILGCFSFMYNDFTKLISNRHRHYFFFVTVWSSSRTQTETREYHSKSNTSMELDLIHFQVWKSLKMETNVWKYFCFLDCFHCSVF